MLREDHSVVDLLNADYTFVNERLARHYGIPNVYGSHFRRVTLTDENRKGLLGQGSILTVTSYANRTSPTFAASGCWKTFWARRRRRRPQRSLPEGTGEGRQGAIHAATDGAAPRESGVRDCHCDGPAGVCAGKLRCDRQMANYEGGGTIDA